MSNPWSQTFVSFALSPQLTPALNYQLRALQEVSQSKTNEIQQKHKGLRKIECLLATAFEKKKINFDCQAAIYSLVAVEGADPGC